MKSLILGKKCWKGDHPIGETWDYSNPSSIPRWQKKGAGLCTATWLGHIYTVYILYIFWGMLCSCAYSSTFFLFASGIYRWDTSLRDLLAKVIIAAVTSFYINGMLQVMNVTRCNQLESRHMESSWYYITLILFIMPKWFLHHMTIILLDDSTLVSTDDTWWYHNMLQILIINWNDCFWYTTIII